MEDFFALDLDFRVAMLSYNIIDNSIKPYPVLQEVVGITNNVQTASGYLVNMRSDYSEELVNCLDYGAKMFEKTGEHWKYTNDQVWKMLQQDDKWFYFLERIGKQRKIYSDIHGDVIDYGC